MTCILSLSNQRFMLPNIRIINPKYRAARTRKSASPSSYLLRRAVSCASHLFLAFIPCPFQLNLILFLSALAVEYEELVEALFLGGESRVDSVRDIVISSSIGQAQQSHRHQIHLRQSARSKALLFFLHFTRLDPVYVVVHD
jgi:hypothetical protein